MNIRLFGACAALVCALGLADAAQAATETLTFSGATNYGAFSGSAVLDVQGGVAVSGSGSISGTDLGTQSLDLITASTPGAEVANDGTFGYRSNKGDDFFGFDDIAPSDFLFAVGPSAPTPGGNLIFGIYDAGGGNYESGFFGASSNDTRFYEYDTPASLTATVSAAPEPSTWLLMLAGVGGIGLMMRRAKMAAGLASKTALTA